MVSNSYRKRCLDEKGEQCIECGATDGIEVHHLDGDRGNDTLDNLIPLCRHCHRRLHRVGLNGLEAQLKPVEERSHIDNTTTTYGFTCDRVLWEEWKETVPRSKSLEQRIIELIEADTEGRVKEGSGDE